MDLFLFVITIKMCWNYQVSLSFSVLFLLINSYYFIKKPLYWKEYLLFGMFYFIMEVFQTVQWLSGNVYDNSLNGVNQCNSINEGFTVFAHILIWLQPILFGVIGYRTSQYKTFFRRFIIVNLLVFFYSLYSLTYGFSMDNYYSVDNSIFGLSTCTNVGETGHLVWRFKPASIDFFPNYLMYVVMCSLSFLMYDKPEIQIIGTGWAMSLVVTKLVLWPSILEMASSWCLLSIVANVIIFVNIQMEKIYISA